MRWLLLFVAVSASADCKPDVLYSTTDYIQRAVVDDGALYVSLLLAHDIERIDLTTGERTIVSTDDIGAWDVQNGLFVTPASIGRAPDDVKRITIRDGSVYWLDKGETLHRSMLGGGITEAIGERVADYKVFEDRVAFISDRELFVKRLTDVTPSLLLSDVDDLDGVTSVGVVVTRYGSGSGLYEVRGEILRVSWSGDVEKVYEENSVTYHNVFTLSAVAAGDVTYITVTNSYHTILMAVRDGVAVELYTALLIDILAADDQTPTFLEWGGFGGATGWHNLVRLFCRDRLRTRAVR